MIGYLIPIVQMVVCFSRMPTIQPQVNFPHSNRHESHCLRMLASLLPWRFRPTGYRNGYPLATLKSSAPLLTFLRSWMHSEQEHTRPCCCPSVHWKKLPTARFFILQPCALFHQRAQTVWPAPTRRLSIQELFWPLHPHSPRRFQGGSWVLFSPAHRTLPASIGVNQRISRLLTRP